MSVSFAARSAAAGGFRLPEFVDRKMASTPSPRNFSTIGTSGADNVQCNFFFDGGSSLDVRASAIGNQSGTFDLAQVQLEVGGSATAFDQGPIGHEMMLCQRYYEAARYARAGYNARATSANETMTIPWLTLTGC